MSLCVSLCLLLYFVAPSYKQPFAIADSQKKLVEQIVILLWKYFPNFPGGGTAFTLVSSTPMPQRMCPFEKQPSFVSVAALGHSQILQRYIFMHLCC